MDDRKDRKPDTGLADLLRLVAMVCAASVITFALIQNAGGAL